MLSLVADDYNNEEENVDSSASSSASLSCPSPSVSSSSSSTSKSNTLFSVLPAPSNKRKLATTKAKKQKKLKPIEKVEISSTVLPTTSSTEGKASDSFDISSFLPAPQHDADKMFQRSLLRKAHTATEPEPSSSPSDPSISSSTTSYSTSSSASTTSCSSSSSFSLSSSSALASYTSPPPRLAKSSAPSVSMSSSSRFSHSSSSSSSSSSSFEKYAPLVGPLLPSSCSTVPLSSSPSLVNAPPGLSIKKPSVVHQPTPSASEGSILASTASLSESSLLPSVSPSANDTPYPISQDELQAALCQDPKMAAELRRGVEFINVKSSDLTKMSIQEKLHAEFEGKFVPSSDVKLSAKFWNVKGGQSVVVHTPDKVHKRKHQINSLATQALVMEAELQKRKAMGYQSKQQRNARYGW
eukprot:TRINITY_DN417_c2_g1_i1.p1 TRINITY_DN417_c2_g1~~TRINITY_DN417_c2_g1_i1.p1  ORF type:complete len:412 (+),score=151.58 TRINITY_DN417_c2_g1_i1:71-1306(+)